jgi:hypothetical protein
MPNKFKLTRKLSFLKGFTQMFGLIFVTYALGELINKKPEQKSSAFVDLSTYLGKKLFL